MGEAEKPPRRPAKKARCAIYTRKSSEEGLEQAFNSLDAQREACAAFILSQKHEGWSVSCSAREKSQPRNGPGEIFTTVTAEIARQTVSAANRFGTRNR
jgi:invasion protein IalB